MLGSNPTAGIEKIYNKSIIRAFIKKDTYSSCRLICIRDVNIIRIVFKIVFYSSFLELLN